MIFTSSKRKSLNTIIADKNIEIKKGSITVNNDITELTQEALNKISDEYYYATKNAYILPTDKEFLRSVIPNFIMNGDPVGIIKDREKIVGLIAGTITKSEFANHNTLFIRFYNTTLLGFKAAAALVASHKFMIEYARTRDIDYVWTTSISYDFKRDFNKILELNGWKSQGYISMYTLKEI